LRFFRELPQPMRINHNISSMIGQKSLQTGQASLSGSLHKLSTGLRINRASDDAAGLSVSESLRARVRGMKQANANASDGIALLQIADGAASEIGQVLQRMRELAIQSSNDTLTTVDRRFLQREMDQLYGEIDRISGSASYNGMNLLNGTAGAFGSTGGASVLHVGAGSSSHDRISVTINPLTTGALDLFNMWESGGSMSFALYANPAMGITWHGNGLSVESRTITNMMGVTSHWTAPQYAGFAIIKLDNAISSVNAMRSDLGAYVNRLEFAIQNQANQIFNTQDAESRIRDVDFAQETAFFTRSQILAQSATSMLAQANQVPQGVLSLLNA
jgi:flagellin